MSSIICLVESLHNRFIFDHIYGYWEIKLNKGKFESYKTKKLAIIFPSYPLDKLPTNVAQFT